MSAVFDNNNSLSASKCLSKNLSIGLSECLPKCSPKCLSINNNKKASFYQKLNHKVHQWLARSSQRRQLAKLDDRMLMDIGYTREQVNIEIAKPFWQ